MGSLTSSLLSASADKTAQAAADLKNSQDQKPSAGKGLKKSVSGATQPPSASGGGLKQVGSDIKSGVQKVVGSFHDGGTVPKTGVYKLHEGEEVIPAKRASEYRKVYMSRKNKKTQGE